MESTQIFSLRWLLTPLRLLERKLQLFFWPVLIRLEKGNAIWEHVLSKREHSGSLAYKIGTEVEKQVLKNHDEIVDIISTHIHLTEPDEELEKLIRKYIKNVTLYKALRDAGEDKALPISLGAEWPHGFYNAIRIRTNDFQSQLNSYYLY